MRCCGSCLTSAGKLLPSPEPIEDGHDWVVGRRHRLHVLTATARASALPGVVVLLPEELLALAEVALWAVDELVCYQLTPANLCDNVKLWRDSGAKLRRSRFTSAGSGLAPAIKTDMDFLKLVLRCAKLIVYLGRCTMARFRKNCLSVIIVTIRAALGLVICFLGPTEKISWMRREKAEVPLPDPLCRESLILPLS